MIAYPIRSAAAFTLAIGLLGASAACASKIETSPLPTSDAQAQLDANATDAEENSDTPPAYDAGPPTGPKSTRCATSFGDALQAPFGRLDGTVLAIVKPTDSQCTLPNRTHVTLQVLSGGKVYRMVTNVVSTRAGIEPEVRFAALQRPLPAPTWADGWHVNAGLDYVTTLNVHNADFTALAMDKLVTTIDDAISLDAKVSVYATTSGGASAHLVHRNKSNADGAIVLNPDSATPTFLLFHFAQQTF